MNKVYVDDKMEILKPGHEYKNKYLHIRFQDGAVQEVGDVNGTCNETILEMLIDRMNYLQDIHQGGKFKCRENSLVITKLEEALHWLEHRTHKRLLQGVEGLNQVHKS